MSIIESDNAQNTFKVSLLKMEDIIQYLKFILNYIQKICKIYYDTNKNIPDIIKESDLSPLKNISQQELHIMEIATFDKTIDYYSYVIPVFKNNIIKIKNSSYFNLKNYLYKDLIDISTLINEIINKNEKSIEDNIIKLYIFHLINTFTECKEKVEFSKIFFKMGQIALIKEYQIKDLDKFFPIDIKREKYKELLNSMKNLIIKCHNIYNDNIKNHSENIKDNFPIRIKKIKEIITNEIANLERELNLIPKALTIKEILCELGGILLYVNSINELIPYKQLIFSITNIINDMNEYDISYTLCFIDINIISKSLEQRKKECRDLKKYSNEENYNDWVLYLLKFQKYDNLKTILTNNKQMSFTQEYKEILADTQFQKKIVLFFKSKSIKAFVKTNLEKRISSQIDDNNYELFINLLSGKKFWNSIMYFTLPKYIKGFICSYMRIVINDNFITFNRVERKEQKNELLKFYLFELIVYELMLFLRRYCLICLENQKAITPPSSQESQINKRTSTSGEIEESFINYIFGLKRITLITLKQAKQFSKLTFESEKDLDELKKIISLEPSSDKDSNIYIKFQDSNSYLKNATYAKIEGRCLYSFRNNSNFK